MKIMYKLFLTVVAACMFLISCNASKTDGIAGKWQASVGPNGDMVVTYIFKVDGETLTGTVTSPRGDEQEIQNGKINGNEFSFEVTMRDRTMTQTGVLDGDVIKLKMERPEGGPQGRPEGAPQGEMQDGEAPQGPPPGDSINRPEPPKGEKGERGPGHGGPGGGEMTLTRVK